ncbi:MAG: Asp/Glu/hydantoin racemase [Confluentimicrobium sp.]|jgi:maleate isomerase|uniref:maleate cis-trans isomerase family protein n=1 Tax=Actibacterium sp. TaxID=1872125 RepID=UPI000C5463B3|nr:Asp/Glu/hydantoin racemase [Actibacterium sp.]MBC57562.1 Asp/Glu/hydantoin racemase [Actibacterium sp.]
MSFAPVDGARAGMLTPSSNTVLEPYTSAMFAPFGDEASAHFGRFRVVEISMSDASQTQFQHDPILDAARRLAEALPRVIAWNGTSASWLGLDKDLALCAAIEAETGVRATSTVLAYDKILRAMKARRIGLVTPYLDEIQHRIIANYADQGIEVVAEERLGDKGNYSFATYPAEQVGAMTRSAAKARPDAIVIMCTNFRGAPEAARIEAETGVPVLDSVAVTAAHCLREMGLDPARVTGWGSVFQRFSDIS